VSLANDPTDPVGEYLVSPDGDTLGYGQNSLNGTSSTTASAYTLDPVAGTWTLLVAFGEPVVGNELADRFVGNIRFNSVQANAFGLPDSGHTKLAAGTPVTVPVRVTNTGIAPEEYSVDPRLNGSQELTLAGLVPTTGLALPLQSEPYWFVPTETSSVSVAATASLPIMFDFDNDAGDPDIPSSSLGSGSLCSISPTGNYSAADGVVTSGIWFAAPTECGPYAAPAPAGTTSVAMEADTAPFDPSVTSSTGDLEVESVNPAASYSPLVLNPGRSGTIEVTITPSASPGTKVQGTLYVNDFNSDVPPPAYEQEAADELAAFPYKYKIK
jgi:hypothetical protein